MKKNIIENWWKLTLKICVLEKAFQNPNTKIIIDFDCESMVSINSLAVNKSNNGTFFKQNAYVCEIITYDLHLWASANLLFSKEKTIEIYRKYNIEILFCYHVLTDIDSTCPMFLIICNVKKKQSPRQNISRVTLSQLTLRTSPKDLYL